MSFTNEQIADACVKAVDLLKEHGRIVGMMCDNKGMCALGAVAKALGLNPINVSISRVIFRLDGETDETFGQRESFASVLPKLNDACTDIGITRELFDYNDGKHPVSPETDADVYSVLLRISDVIRNSKDV